MRLKTIVSGIIGFGGAYFALMRLMYDALPATILNEWPAPIWEGVVEEKWVQIAVFGFAALSVFLGGWLSASWNKARHWKESIRFGSSAGLISGALSFNFVGAAWAGLVAQREVLETTNIALTEMEGGKILVNAVTKTIQQSYSVIWLFILSALVLGALGGLLYVFDIRPKEKEMRPRESGWLFRLPAHTLTLSGIASFIVMYAIISILSEIIADTAVDYNMMPDLPPQLILALVVTSIIPLFGIPFLLTLIWMIRRWKINKEGGILFFIWTVFLFALVYFFSNNTLRYIFSLLEIGLANVVITLFAIFLGVFLLMWFLSVEPAEDRLRFSFADWMGYALTQGILGGTQLFASSMAFAFSVVLITVNNIPHLMSTPSDTPPTPPVEQIESLFRTQQGMSLYAMGAMFVIALILGGITALLRGITGMNKKLPEARKSQEVEFKMDSMDW